MILLAFILQFTLTIDQVNARGAREVALWLTSLSVAESSGRNEVTANSKQLLNSRPGTQTADSTSHYTLDEGLRTAWNIGDEWSPTERLEVAHNGSPARLVRFTRSNGENAHLGGEHISLSFDAATGLLLGLTRMERRFFDTMREGSLLDRPASQRAADAFLACHAEDLVGRVRVLWIEPHEEIVNAEGREVITGMKVKMRQNDGRYAWVIIGAGEEVITFERDIVWNTSRSERSTEKWLHDEWRTHG